MKKGFTLLEMLVASLIMAVAVVAAISAIGNSLRNASRLTTYDRAVMLGRSKMDELLADQRIPLGANLEGTFDSDESGWRASFTPYDVKRTNVPGSLILERVEMEIWWTADGKRSSFPVEAFKRTVMPQPLQ